MDLGTPKTYANTRAAIAAMNDLLALSNLMEDLSDAAEDAYDADDVERLLNLGRLWLLIGYRLATMRLAHPGRFREMPVLDDHTAALASDVTASDFEAVVEMDPPPDSLSEALALAKARAGRLN